MDIRDIPFGVTDWAQIERSEHAGTTGSAYWRTRRFGTLCVRMVDYTPGYLADHWCQKGHILLCLEGELHTELADGRRTAVYRRLTRADATHPQGAHGRPGPSGARGIVSATAPGR
jgi:hypothetical protein